jgi:hypothetical protein
MGLPELVPYIPAKSSPTPHGPTIEGAMVVSKVRDIEDGAIRLILESSYNPWECYPTASLQFRSIGLIQDSLVSIIF